MMSSLFPRRRIPAIFVKSRTNALLNTLHHGLILEFNAIKYESNLVDNRESKVYLSKRLTSDVVRAHTSTRTVVYAD
jgi:hypothetical protein